MLAVWITLAVLLGLLTFLLVTPIILEVDTDSEQPIRVVLRGVFRFAVIVVGDEFMGEVSVFGIRKRFKFKASTKKKEGRKTKFTLRKGMQLLRTFQLRLLDWELDTGDYSLNARLYALTWIVARPNVRIRLNFIGCNRLRLVVVNRLISLGWAFLRK